MICLFFACVLTLENRQILHESINSLNYITDNYFLRKGITVFHEKSDESELLITGIMKNDKNSYIVMNKSYTIGRKSKHLYTNDVIAVVESQKILNEYFENKYWNPRGRIIVILYNDLKAKDIIEQIWNKTRAADFIVMKIGERTHFYTWFPYQKNECSKVGDITLLDEWKNGGFVRNKNLFPKKIPKNFGGCPLYAVSTEVPPLVFNDYKDGYELRLVDAIADFHNFKLIFVPPPEGESFWLTNSTVDYAGAMSLLMKHSADIAFGSLMTRSDRNEIADMLYPHIHENLLWIFPAPGQISNFSNIYTIFSLKAWINIIFLHFWIFAAFYFIGRVAPTREPDSYSDLVSCFLTPIAIITNNAVSKPRGNYLRFACLTYVIYALHVTTAYTSSLVVELTDYDTEKPYETVQELVDAGLFCYIYRSAVNVFINVTDHDLWNQILQPGRHKFMTGLGADNMKSEVAYRKRAFMLFPKSNLQYASPGKYKDNRGRSLFNWIHYLSYTMSIWVSPGNPLRDLLSETLLRIMSAGLMKFWMENINNNINRKEGSIPSESGDETEGQPRLLLPLSVKHLEGAFLFHFIFSMISILIFFGEVSMYRKIRKSSALK